MTSLGVAPASPESAISAASPSWHGSWLSASRGKRCRTTATPAWRDHRRALNMKQIDLPTAAGRLRRFLATALGAAAALCVAVPPAFAAATVNKGDTSWMLVATILVILMTIPGLALFYGGLVRSK